MPDHRKHKIVNLINQNHLRLCFDLRRATGTHTDSKWAQSMNKQIDSIHVKFMIFRFDRGNENYERKWRSQFDKTANCFTQIRDFVKGLNHRNQNWVCRARVLISSTRWTSNYHDSSLRRRGLSQNYVCIIRFTNGWEKFRATVKLSFTARHATRMSSNSISTFSFNVHFKEFRKFNFFRFGQTRQMQNNNRKFPSFSWLGFLPFASLSPHREYFEKIPRFNVFRTGEMLSSTIRSFVRLFVAFVSPTWIYQKKRRKGRSQKVSREKTLINKWKMNFAFFREFLSIELPQPSSGFLTSLFSLIIRFDFPKKILNFPSPC